MKIQPIVEGHGEIDAVPVLLRRFKDMVELHQLDIGSPIKKPRTQITKETTLKAAVRLASIQPECGAIIILFDADDDCPKEMAVQIVQWANEESGHIPCAVVMACREYEAWFLASAESLRGLHHIENTVTSLSNAESFRDAKGQVSNLMSSRYGYAPTVDQAGLTNSFSFEMAYRNSRSFRKMTKAFGDLASAMGLVMPEWPPSNWVEHD